MHQFSPRIVFLSHSASRNGATILLLDLLRWLNRETNCGLHVILHGGGPLAEEFRALGRVSVWRNPGFFLRALPPRWETQLRPRLEEICFKTRFRRSRYDLVYANTSATWPHVRALGTSAKPIVWHIHEMEYALKLSMGEPLIRQLFPLATRFVSVSKSVSATLQTCGLVSPDKIDLIHGFVPTPDISREDRNLRRKQIRQKFGWGDDTFVVGGCGSLGWRKGTDLFLQIAEKHKDNATSNMRFLWVGGAREDQMGLEFAHDFAALNLQNICKWVPAAADVGDYYHAMDAFALTSREDPFPLVMLEAGAVGVPLVCFSGSGGGPEFAARGAGLSAPYLDVGGFASQLAQLQADRPLRDRLGAEAERIVRSHHSIASQAPKIFETINKCLSSANEAKLNKSKPSMISAAALPKI